MADEPLYKTLPKSIVNLAYKYGILSSTSLSDGLYSSKFKSVAGSYNKDSFSIQGTGSFAPVAKSHTFSGDGFVNGSLTLNNASGFFSKFGGECGNGQITPSDFGDGFSLDQSKLTQLLADLQRFGRFTGNLLSGNSDVTVSGSYHHKTNNSEDSSLDEDVSGSFSNKHLDDQIAYNRAKPFFYASADQYNIQLEEVSLSSYVQKNSKSSITNGVALLPFFVEYHSYIGGSLQNFTKTYWKFASLATNGSISSSEFTVNALRNIATRAGAVIPETWTGVYNDNVWVRVQMSRPTWFVFSRDGVR